MENEHIPTPTCPLCKKEYTDMIPGHNECPECVVKKLTAEWDEQYKEMKAELEEKDHDLKITKKDFEKERKLAKEQIDIMNKEFDRLSEEFEKKNDEISELKEYQCALRVLLKEFR